MTTTALTTSSVGAAASAGQYVNDLRATMLLIHATWPAEARLTPHTGDADLIEAHINERRSARRARQDKGKRSLAIRSLDAPPTDPAAATAAFLALATRILTAPAAREHLNHLLAHCANTTAVRTRIDHLLPHCSPGLQTALSLRLHDLRIRRKGPRPGHAYTPPVTEDRFDARHIPQYLPDSWFAFLAALGAPAESLRRDAAVRLVQMSRGGSRPQAASYLGFPPPVASQRRLLTWQSAPGNATRYTTALATLADYVATLDQHTDWHRRRTHLQGWSIPGAEWDAIIAAVHHQQTAEEQHKTDWHLYYQAASVWAWAHLTHGDYLYAPARYRRFHGVPGSLSALNRVSRHTHHAFRATLREYCNALATCIDRPAPDTNDRPLLPN
ncbi:MULTISPECIES: hypothetical protein [Streptomyces]|uniref:hypothetical protein n=1 Tax=Streptomyces lycopersici TaxID=2974589 RepID=UPI0021CF720D|nr:hypothetical protein [Streptomyces sp. NEAU-383]